LGDWTTLEKKGLVLSGRKKLPLTEGTLVTRAHIAAFESFRRRKNCRQKNQRPPTCPADKKNEQLSVEKYVLESGASGYSPRGATVHSGTSFPNRNRSFTKKIERRKRNVRSLGDGKREKARTPEGALGCEPWIALRASADRRSLWSKERRNRLASAPSEEAPLLLQASFLLCSQRSSKGRKNEGRTDTDERKRAKSSSLNS